MSDFVYLLEIYAASEKPMEGISSLLISKLMPPEKVKFEPSMLQVVNDVVSAAQPGDLILILGAGDVSSLCAPILDSLAAKSSNTEV